MAQIREELILTDKFTAPFTKYLDQAHAAAASTKELKDAAARAAAQNQILSTSFTAAGAEARAMAAQQQAAAAASNATAAAARAESAQIRLAKTKQKELDDQQKQLESSTASLIGKVKSLVAAYAGMQAIQGLVTLSDTMTQTNARLDMMNDGLQTTAELNQMIYESAQRSRGSYQATADMVAKLGNLAGDAFNSSAELVDFAEQLNKQITLSGASTAGAEAAMLQLTQAMSSGMLRGEELNSILEQTPTIAQSIAKYMGVSTGEMRELASEGAITAEVVKNALFDAAEETNAKFEEMPMTWAQVWTSAKNTAIMAMQPVLDVINAAVNNLDILIPIVATAGAAFAVFMLAANWTKICTAATTLLTNAQKVLNAVMATGWGIPLIAIVAVVGALYILVAAYNKVTGATVSATGIIAGLFFALGAQVLNTCVVPVQRGFATLVNFIGNVFNDPITSVKVLFYDMAITVLGYIRSLVGGIEDLINAIPGVQVSLTSGINGIYNSLQANREAAIAAGSYKEYVKPMEYFDLGDSFQYGYNKGAGLASSLSGFFSSSSATSTSLSAVPTYDEVAGTTLDDISKSTSGIEKSVAMSDEDLKSLVDVAERRYVNRINLTAQTPVITVNGQNTGNTEADRRSLANTIRDILVEQVSSGSTRSTARAY